MADTVETAARIVIPMSRVAIKYRRDNKTEVIYSVRIDGESVEEFFLRISKTVEDLLTHVTDEIKHVRFTSSFVESDLVL
jgi:hypothetical protein